MLQKSAVAQALPGEHRKSWRGGGGLPVVPQVHCTLLDFAEDFKAALQLGAGAVRPQSPHVHDPSLLLLVKGRHRQRGGGEIKGVGECFFLLTQL